MHEKFLRPGLDQAMSRTIEECAELIKNICKAQRFGLESSNPLLPPEERILNKELIRGEAYDVRHAIENLFAELDTYDLLRNS